MLKPAEIFAINLALILINDNDICQNFNFEYTPLEIFLRAGKRYYYKVKSGVSESEMKINAERIINIE